MMGNDETNHTTQPPADEDDAIEEGVIIDGEATADNKSREPDEIIGGLTPPDHTLRNILIALTVLVILLCCCCTLMLVALAASGFFDALADEFADAVFLLGQYRV